MQAKQLKPGFTERLKQIIGEQKPYTWAKNVGIGKSTLYGILNKGAHPQLHTLMKIAWKTNVSMSWLLTGKGTIRLIDSLEDLRNAALFSDSKSGEKESYILIPRHNGYNEDEAGDLLSSAQSTAHMAFKTTWVTQEMGLDPKELVLISVQGDSMTPTLEEGDLLLLDKREERVCNDGMYVIKQENDLIVKRLQRGFDGSLRIKSDNRAYDTQTIQEDQIERLTIVGRVVWIGHRL